MKYITMTLTLAFTGCGFLGSPAGQAIARTAIDIARDVLIERLAGTDPTTEAFCVGEEDERVCYVPDPTQAAAVILRDFEDRGAAPDTKNTFCFDAAEETGNDRVPGLVCYVPECFMCNSTGEEIDHVRDGTEEAAAAQRDGAGAGHREGPAASSDGVHPGGRRRDGGVDVRDGEGPGDEVVHRRGAGRNHHRRGEGRSRIVQLWLARAAVGECDLILPDCHAGTWWTLHRRWVRVMRRWPSYTLDQMARNYCAVFKGKPEGRKRWVRGLVAAATLPDGWPQARVPWERRSARWTSIYARAGAFLRGEVKDPCRGKPVHFGAGTDLLRFSLQDWERVHCGRTQAQTFLQVRR